jgi:hypothetical protein
MSSPEVAHTMLVLSCLDACVSEKAQSCLEASSEGLVIIAVSCPVPKHLTDFTVWPLLTPTAMVCGMGRVLRHLCLCGTVLCVMEIKAVTDVTEKAWFLLGLFLLVITTNVNV